MQQMHTMRQANGLAGFPKRAPEQVERMAERPLIMALANPEPEILPELVREVRPDAIIGTGRSDYPNQINNVLVFPYIFRGALDVGATDINKAMKIACVEALADLVMEEADEEVAALGAQVERAIGESHRELGDRDETAAAIVTDTLQVLSSAVASQDELHARFRGVVPEIAARAHVERILPVLELALQRYALDALLAEGFMPMVTPDLARNDILELAPGDTVTVSYLDEITAGGAQRNRLLTRKLTATYFNGQITPVSYDFVRTGGGSVRDLTCVHE